MSSKYNNIDDLFRDKFKNFEPEPPAHVWDNIQESIGRSNKPFTNGGIAGLTSIVILAGLFTFFNITGFQSSDNFNVDEVTELSVSNDLLAIYQNSEEINSIIQEQEISSEIDSKTESPVDKLNSIPLPQTESSIARILVEKKEKERIALSAVTSEELFNKFDDQSNVIIEEAGILDQDLENADRDLLAMASDENDISTFSSEVTQSVAEALSKEVIAANSIMNESTDASIPAEPAEPGIRSDYGKRNNFLFGLHFTPELTYYPEDDKYSNRSFSFDLSAIYQFSGYTLQSGLGLSWVKDDGNYAIDYEKYEYMGSYQDVYDITFDTIGGEIVPTYHTQEIEVYDSIQHLSISPTKNKYTYLQIPVLFGYGDDIGRFSWFVKGGPNLSIMIHENRPGMNMPGTDINILSIDNKLPTRIKANWQLLFSAGASYKLSNNLSLSVEPMLRYYIKSAYDRNNMQTKHPYSVGLKTGLLINF